MKAKTERAAIENIVAVRQGKKYSEFENSCREISQLRATGHADDFGIGAAFVPETKENEVRGSELQFGRSGSAIVEYVLVQKHAQRMNR